MLDVDKQYLRHCIQAMELLNSSLGENSVRYSTVDEWFARFHCINLCLTNDPHPRAVKKCEDEELEVLLD